MSNQAVFMHFSVNVAAGDVIPSLQLLQIDLEIDGFKVPRYFLVEGRVVDSTGNVNALRQRLNILKLRLLDLEWSLNSIENTFHDT